MRLLKLTTRLFTLFVLSVYALMSTVAALSPTQKDIFNSGSYYFDEVVACDNRCIQPDLTTIPLREKLAQMLMPRVDSDDNVDDVTADKVGGMFAGSDYVESVDGKLNDIQANAAVPYIIAADGEGGTVGPDITDKPPSALEMSRQANNIVKQHGLDYGTALKEKGITMDLAPVADIVENPNDQNGPIKTRGFGSTRQLVTEKAGAFAEGLREANLLPTFKHFPGHGHARTATGGGGRLSNSHSDINNYTPNIATLRNEDIKVFQDLIAAGPGAVMMGHLMIPDINPDKPASLDSRVINDILRGELGYTGVVITDDLADMAPIGEHSSDLPDAVLKAILAGNDIALYNAPEETGAILDRLEAANESGELTEERIDESMERIKNAKPMSENCPNTPVDPIDIQMASSNRFNYPEISPTAIVLHWTGGGYDSPEQLINTLRSRTDSTYPQGRAVQLTVDTDGSVYQLSDSLATKPIQTMPEGPDDPWNNKSIGIEIESNATTVAGAKEELLNNTAQYESVLRLVRYLMEEYDIQNVANEATYTGIFGHHELNPGNSDPSPEYMQRVRQDLDTVAVPPGGGLDAVPEHCTCGGESDINGENNAEILLRYFVSKGLTLEQAAGIVGNFQQESSPDIDPNASNGTHYGIAQWDIGGREGNLRAFANATNRGAQFNTLEVQMEFAWYELSGEPAGLGIPEWSGVHTVLDALKATNTAEEAAIVIEAKYEISGGSALDRRIGFANALAEQYSGTIDGGGIASGCAVGTDDIDRFPLDTTKAVIEAGAANASGGVLKWLWDKDTNYHHDYNAADIHAAYGTPVVAAGPGKVVDVKEGHNASVQIQGSDGRWTYYYTHMALGSIRVQDEQEVTAGQIIGEVGDYNDTGNGSAGHLHFDMLPQAEYPYRVNCSGPSCAGYPFLDVQPQLKQLYETQLR